MVATVRAGRGSGWLVCVTRRSAPRERFGPLPAHFGGLTPEKRPTGRGAEAVGAARRFGCCRRANGSSVAGRSDQASRLRVNGERRREKAEPDESTSPDPTVGTCLLRFALGLAWKWGREVPLSGRFKVSFGCLSFCHRDRAGPMRTNESQTETRSRTRGVGGQPRSGL
uniref:Uncharacterized protein n=1 Tax=Sphaerodactylus townsendi TaxID=933632 RepID=A0ACB8EHQ2_9SAUR